MFSEYFYRVTLQDQESRLYTYESVMNGSLWEVKVNGFTQACRSRSLQPGRTTSLDIFLVPNTPLPGVYVYEFAVKSRQVIVTQTERVQINEGVTVQEVFNSLYRSICSQYGFNPSTTHVLNTFFMREK